VLLLRWLDDDCFLLLSLRLTDCLGAATVVVDVA